VSSGGSPDSRAKEDVAAVDCRGEEAACIAGSEETLIWPSLIAHADWGTDRRKRQVAVARLSCRGGDSHGCYVMESLAPPLVRVSSSAGSVSLLVLARHSRRRLRAGATPRVCGRSRDQGVPSIPGGPWHAAVAEFHLVADQPDQITLYRPFYPMRPGSSHREHLYLAVGLSARNLRRHCEGTDAEALFWTLGGKQVGKGALIGWQLIAAARRLRQAS